MLIKFQEINNPAEWDKKINQFDFFSFLQTSAWGKFQNSLGNKIYKIIGQNGDNIVLLSQLIKIKAKRSTLLLCPHGPLISNNKAEIYRQFTEYLKKIAKKENIDFIRLNSLLINNRENLQLLKKLGWIFSPMHQHAETTWLLNLNLSLKELMQGMRKTTRYLIKRAEKEGVIISKDNSGQAIEEFIKLHQQHAQTNRYEPFNPEYIRNLFKAFAPEQISLKFAKFENKIEAASIIIFTPPQAAYYLAISHTNHSQFSPAYLLQWQSIIEAKEKGCEVYNFWGISPDENIKHPLHGVSLFKRGFGGYKLDLLHAQDLSITKKYFLNYVIETFRRIKRGYYYIKPKI